MTDKRLQMILTFSVVGVLVLVSGVLIVLNKSGTTQFELFGQKFSSTNVGLAVLFMAVVVLIYAIWTSAPSRDAAPGTSHVYASSASGEQITWAEFISGVNDLVLQLTAADGFRPDLIIGICGGGLMVADLVAKRLGHIPCLAIWGNRHSRSQGSTFAGLAASFNTIPFDQTFRAAAVHRLLLVDDVAYSGKTLKEAVDYITSSSELLRSGEVEMRTAVLFSLTSAQFKSDFVIYMHSRSRRMMPSSDRLRG